MAFNPSNTQLERHAEEIATTVRALHQLLRRPFEADIAGSGLTVPQVNALEELAKKDGLSLKELSRRLYLSHSTVSGIVDRLERRELVRRVPNEQDRRYSRIVLAEGVKAYVSETVPPRRLGPLLEALSRASADEREGILLGLRTLKRLLEAVHEDEPSPAQGDGTLPS